MSEIVLDSSVLVNPMPFDLVIRGGTVVDGTGRPAARADVAIRGGRIAAVGDLAALADTPALDATGRVVAPGFIDMHTHSDFVLAIDGRGESKLRQGVTADVIGNCSYAAFPSPPGAIEGLRQAMAMLSADESPWEWTDLEGYRRFLESRGLGVNVVPLIGHGPVRVTAMGYDRRPPTPDELQTMGRLVAIAMDQGAFGMTTGLTLAPSSFADTPEIVALSRVVARRGGFYATHMRVYQGRALEAREEAIRIGREAGIAVQMSHNNLSGRGEWYLLPDMVAMMERARAAGMDLYFDVYPYNAGQSILSQLLPDWTMEGGVAALEARLRDPLTRGRVRSEMLEPETHGLWRFEYDKVRVTEVAREEDKHLEGLLLVEVAERLGTDPIDAYLTLVERDRASAVFELQSEENTRALLRHPFATVGSDGYAVTLGDPSARGRPHPRFFGTFPRVLGRYVREWGLLGLEEAIHKLTGLPARRLGLSDRGELAVGKVADIAIFDPATVLDTATYTATNQYPVGVETVLVAGQPVLLDGALTDARPGKVLARP